MFNPFLRSLSFSLIALFIGCFALISNSYARSSTQMCAVMGWCMMSSHDTATHIVSIYAIFPHSQFKCYVETGPNPVYLSNISSENVSYYFAQQSGTLFGPITFTNNTDYPGTVTFDYQFEALSMYPNNAKIACNLTKK